IFQTLPKQVAPYVMLRQHMITGFGEALREAVLLGKAWGITKEWIVDGLMVSAWSTGFEALYAAQDALDDVLDSSEQRRDTHRWTSRELRERRGTAWAVRGVRR